MAGSTGPDIVTDGLVQALDAANKKSYPGSGTTVTDISQTKATATLSNTTFSEDPVLGVDAFYFDGTDDRINSSFSELNSVSALSIDVWFYQTSAEATTSGTGVICGWGSTSVTTQFMRVSVSNGSFIAQTRVGGIIDIDQTGVIYSAGWNHYTYVFDGTSNFYLNGVSQSYTSTNGGVVYVTDSISNNIFHIGALQRGGGLETWYEGRIGLLKLYNRALTSQEVLQNYNANKSRFGL